jgi:hypothetical protein
MGTGADAGAWACSDCGARWDEKGDCRGCGQGPLVDLRESNVRDALVEEDRRRAERRSQRMLVVAIGLILSAWLLGGLVSFAILLAPLARPGGLLFIALLAVGAMGLRKLLAALFPAKPRFPYLLL